MQSNNLPDFFIVGAPRAGTTALYHYLNQHPDVFVPRVKEPHYFGRDLKFAAPRISFEEYKGLFQPATEKVVGEGSVMYLMSHTAAEEIKEHCPDARIIIMLRHPVDLIISLHRKMLLYGNESIENLEKALDAEDARKDGREISPLAHRINLLYYSDVIRFGPQVERYFNVFGKENTHVILYDDFKEDTDSAYKSVLNFLNLSPEYTPEYKIINFTKNVRFRFIRDLLSFIQVKSSPQVKELVRKITPNKLRYAIYAATNRMTQTDKPVTEINNDLKQKLQIRFQSNIMELSNILNKDLSMWLAKY
ncbi:MAG: sulfotransferase [Desulfobacteraceae bacterium]|jgi:hypothetical protein|nr:sulfotransferase [Desulfobacteraceae bacterium]